MGAVHAPPAGLPALFRLRLRWTPAQKGNPQLLQAPDPTLAKHAAPSFLAGTKEQALGLWFHVPRGWGGRSGTVATPALAILGSCWGWSLNSRGSSGRPGELAGGPACMSPPAPARGG